MPGILDFLSNGGVWNENPGGILNRYPAGSTGDPSAGAPPWVAPEPEVPLWMRLLKGGLLGAYYGGQAPASSGLIGGAANGLIGVMDWQAREADADARRRRSAYDEWRMTRDWQLDQEREAASNQQLATLESLFANTESGPTPPTGPLAAGAPPVGTAPYGMDNMGDPGADPLAGVPTLPPEATMPANASPQEFAEWFRRNAPENVKNAVGLMTKAGNAEGAWKILTDWMTQTDKQFTPHLETFNRGDLSVTGYYGPDEVWNEVATAPRWQPTQPAQPEARWTLIDDPTQYGFPAGSVVTQNSLTGDFQVEHRPGEGGTGVTPSQEANNAEILRAREFIDAQNLTPAELAMAAKPTNDLGMPNPNFNPMIELALRKSMQRLVGDDPGYDAYTRKYFGLVGPVAGGDSPAPVGDSGSDGAGALDLPTGSDGTVSAQNLKPGTIYNTPQGPARWNGLVFEVVR